MPWFHIVFSPKLLLLFCLVPEFGSHCCRSSELPNSTMEPFSCCCLWLSPPTYLATIILQWASWCFCSCERWASEFLGCLLTERSLLVCSVLGSFGSSFRKEVGDKEIAQTSEVTEYPWNPALGYRQEDISSLILDCVVSPKKQERWNELECWLFFKS